MQDLESGLSYILNIEVATKLRMGESAYRALRDFIELLSKVTKS